MNIVVLKGNLTRDPEVKTVGVGDKQTQVANFTVAVNRYFTRADGTKDKETNYVDCEAWDTGAERLGEHCKKGDPILVNGSLKLDTWEVENQKRSKLKVRVSNFDRLFRSPGNGDSAQAASSDAEEAVAASAGSEDPEIPF